MSDQNAEAILAVEDDEDFLLFVQTVLRKAGMTVVGAASAAEARALMRARRFAVVLTDLRLPASASGLDVLAAARNADPLSVGIVLTGHGSADTALEALREGAYDYLIKPCASDALLAAVRRGLEHYRLKVALIQKTSQLEELRTELNSKSKLLQNVSHELKNPLTVVYGYSSFLLKQDPGATKPEDLRRSLQSIHSNAERLGHLLEELIDSARISNQKITLRREPLEASDLCEQAFDNARFEAEARGVRLHGETPDAEAWVLADHKRIHQVLSNLVGNALKFTPRGGSITLSAAVDGDSVRFSVSDSGIGIKPADLPHLFERFYQCEESRKDHQGLGLGLEICKGLVELHGGRIWAESEPGRGSTFHFSLPVLTPDSRLPLPSRRHGESARPGA